MPTAADLVQINTITPRVTVIAGGAAAALGTDIGENVGSQGEVTVTGAGWTNSGLLSVGTNGVGTLSPSRTEDR